MSPPTTATPTAAETEAAAETAGTEETGAEARAETGTARWERRARRLRWFWRAEVAAVCATYVFAERATCFVEAAPSAWIE